MDNRDRIERLKKLIELYKGVVEEVPFFAPLGFLKDIVQQLETLEEVREFCEQNKDMTIDGIEKGNNSPQEKEVLGVLNVVLAILNKGEK